MNIDKQEIKALALACDPAKCADEAEEGRRLAELYSELTPEGVLALIEEAEQLRDAHEQVCTNYNRVSFVAGERGEERDRLKDENDTLKAAAMGIRDAWREDQVELEALRKDAERYRWLCSKWLSASQDPGDGFGAALGLLFMIKGEKWSGLNGSIDAAMAKEASRG